MKTAREWKAYYAAERERLGEAGLAARLDAAREIDVPDRGALVFPHTRLDTSGALAAAVANAVVRCGCDEVVALGVLHGGRAADADLVRQARDGDAKASALLRRVHGPGTPDDAGRWHEEFSLDGFEALVALAAQRAGRAPPRIVARYPFLVGETPGDLPGIDAIAERLARGAVLVATADPIHHGAGYGAPEEDRLSERDPQTLDFARWTVGRAFERLAAHAYGSFLQHALDVRSDFRDAGPCLSWLVSPTEPLHCTLFDLELVDYSDALGAPRPTWVAGALASFELP